jgi:hypothetical protein
MRRRAGSRARSGAGRSPPVCAGSVRVEPMPARWRRSQIRRPAPTRQPRPSGSCLRAPCRPRSGRLSQPLDVALQVAQSKPSCEDPVVLSEDSAVGQTDRPTSINRPDHQCLSCHHTPVALPGDEMLLEVGCRLMSTVRACMTNVRLSAPSAVISVSPRAVSLRFASRGQPEKAHSL